MLDIFKLYINNINKINELYLFSKNFENIKEKSKYNIEEFILSDIYKTNDNLLNIHEIKLLKKNNSNVYLCDTNIFFDDTIEFVKFKFLKYYNKYNKEQLGYKITNNKEIENYDNCWKEISFMIFRTGSVLIVGNCDSYILNIFSFFLV